ncbi:AfsR/SARP family transcriptional regulator [Streptomyces sp. NRRL B-1347]|uniref:AfsR/SARP family transcriptional regulator n=1 Tax=Streptomyces sp. NRRL B-1347 TaxID=1476877 RepID=UPI0007C46CA0|nr:AfsR/SARP family transcriptional regulator [Streptomyces sp. NRRL B-1347]
MDIQVLGSMSVRVAGHSVAPSAPKPRQVLALLALHADQMVPVSTLTAELWGHKPPRSARATLQTYVLQLRDLIGEALAREGSGREGAKDVLVTLPGGYRLQTGGGSVDFRDFERRAATGFHAMDAEDYQGATHKLREALALWSGEGALADIQAGSLITMEVERLEEARLFALDQRIEADLRLGRHRTHEGLHAQFMLALHRSGRRGEALRAYQQLHTTLVCELGLEPSVPLQRLQRSIRAQSDAVEVGGTAGHATEARGATPGFRVAAARVC